MFNVLGEAINIAAIIHNLETTERTDRNLAVSAFRHRNHGRYRGDHGTRSDKGKKHLYPKCRNCELKL
jgi:hypothetical protein